MASLWFYRLGTEQIGPVNANQFRSLAKAGTILPGTAIRKSDDSNWLKAARIKGLFDGVEPVQRTEPERPDEEAPDPLIAVMSHAASSVVSAAGLAASAIGGAVSDWLTRRKDETSERASVPDPTPPAPIQATPSWLNSLWPATPNSALIGVTEAVCPYCAHGLEKMPGRKKKCPSCGNAIFVRTRPQDKSRILVREDQLLAVEEQWSVANGTHGQFLAVQRRIQQTTDTTPNQTEMSRALAQRQLDSLETFGMDDLGVAVEWSTAGDDRVCKLCVPLQGIVLTVAEADGLIPRHEECRCCWIPANVGESKKGQKRTKTAIDKAIDRSIRAELAESGKRSSWAGAHRTIEQKRPKSILD